MFTLNEQKQNQSKERRVNIYSKKKNKSQFLFQGHWSLWQYEQLCASHECSHSRHWARSVSPAEAITEKPSSRSTSSTQATFCAFSSTQSGRAGRQAFGVVASSSLLLGEWPVRCALLQKQPELHGHTKRSRPDSAHKSLLSQAASRRIGSAGPEQAALSCFEHDSGKQLC